MILFKSKPPKYNRDQILSILALSKYLMANITSNELQFAYLVDSDILNPTLEYLSKAGIHCSREDLIDLLERYEYTSYIDQIMFLKEKYNIERPFKLAEMLNVKLPFEHKTISTQCKSYPSGHAFESRFIAYCVAENLLVTHPFKDFHRHRLFEIANQIAWSRVQIGVHSLQDIEEGKRLADMVFYPS